jgi:hypothetical protein
LHAILAQLTKNHQTDEDNQTIIASAAESDMEEYLRVGALSDYFIQLLILYLVGKRFGEFREGFESKFIFRSLF